MKRKKLTIITVILMLLLTQSIILTGCKDEKNNDNQTKTAQNAEENEKVDEPAYFKHQLCKKYKMVIPIEFVVNHTSRFSGKEGTVFTGRVEEGTIKVGDKVEIIGQDSDNGKEVTYFKDVEVLELYSYKDEKEQLFGKLKKEDNLGVLIEGIDPREINENRYAIIR